MGTTKEQRARRAKAEYAQWLRDKDLRQGGHAKYPARPANVARRGRPAAIRRAHPDSTPEHQLETDYTGRTCARCSCGWLGPRRHRSKQGELMMLRDLRSHAVEHGITLSTLDLDLLDVL